ncbi:DNA-processing protein DprA [Sediminitomix flava]|uniref:DNA processing protein n=1 Tax=Sediminitomix flava TaxID=379075 RepID=A0A315ZG86_SEDFL|nr:DNA-processing protein DprA [Sediminitomix flava]PWJ44605.1 DNA processing protein [Sediminitomix flava]
MLSEKEQIYRLALHLTPKIGSRLSRVLLGHFESAENIFSQTKQSLQKIPQIGEGIIHNLFDKMLLERAKEEYELTQKHDISLYFYSEDNYPYKLKQIPDAPTLFYFKGQKESLENQKMVAVVGTRKATEAGRKFCRELIYELQKFNDLTIVSGLAIGIDVEAHKASLKSNIPTIGVMANGMGKVYPSFHNKIAEEMCHQGGLITEGQMFSKPDSGKFPARNRIIAGLCDVTLVIEAAEKGGALITAELANSYDREIMAVPGRPSDKYSAGCNKLIKKHKAHLLNEFSDLEYLMNWGDDGQQLSLFHEKQKPTFHNQDEERIYQELETGVKMLDELVYRLKIPQTQLAALLLSLELNGVIRPLPGKRFELC